MRGSHKTGERACKGNVPENDDINVYTYSLYIVLLCPEISQQSLLVTFLSFPIHGFNI